MPHLRRERGCDEKTNLIQEEIGNILSACHLRPRALKNSPENEQASDASQASTASEIGVVAALFGDYDVDDVVF